MRNLRNLGHWFSQASEDSSGPCVCAWDTSNNDILYAYGPSDSDTKVTLWRWSPGVLGFYGKPKLIATWDAPCPSPDMPHDRILEMLHFSDNASICIVFAGGDIVVVQDSPVLGKEQIEIVGSVDVGIAAASWSPDEELLVILTKASTLLYMSRELENVTDTSLTQNDLKVSKHVSVGWGKAETQFRGKGAKALRDPTIPEKVDQGLPSPHDDGSSTISWRGDGAYVAVNSQLSSDRRVIRIYSREGALDGVTEPVDFLEASLSWRPAGNLMAGIQRLPDRIDVVFFEKNGLRHGQFSLRLTADEMESRASKIDLKWNQDSTVLAVCLPTSVQLWTMGNYHYYLKQEIFHPTDPLNQPQPFFCWHPGQPLFFSVGHNGCIQKSEYGWRVASGTNVQPWDKGLTSVIDGRILKMTPLKLSNVPPPMSLIELGLPDNIIDVAYFDMPKSGENSILLAVLDNTNLSVYGWNLAEKPLKEPHLVQTSKLSTLLPMLMSSSHPYIRQISFLKKDELTLLVDADDSAGSRSQGFDANRSCSYSVKIEENRLHVSGCLPTSHTREFVPRLAKDAGSYLLWLSKHELVLPFDMDGSLGSAWLTPEHYWLDVPSGMQSLAMRIPIDRADFDSSMTFGLKRNGSLFVNASCIAKDCTSFLVSADHLVFTTSQHLLKFVHLAGVKNAEDLEVPPNTPEIDERCRAVERGARLINIIPSISALILQMPRGNLETIYPRALVLPVIRHNINVGKYKKAFLACRNHRVDMNIIHDHAPQKFLANVGDFIDQVKKVENIDLFLSQLKEEDVSVAMYKETLPQARSLTNGVHVSSNNEPKAASGLSKVNKICLAFLEALESRRSTNLQNVITAYICQNPPALEEGLQEIAKIQANSPEDVDRAIEHICFLADVNRLFDTALGMYNLDIALLIAQNSQRDPREYVPFLQKLKEQEPLRMKVDINNHLRRYGKVLDHLYQLNDFEALKKHTIRHSLFRQSIELFRYQESHLQEVMRNYAEFLESKSQFKDAAIAFEFLKEYRLAAEAYRSANIWQEALSCAALVPFDADELRSFATAIADALTESKDYRSAAIIQLDHLQNVESAIRLFCKGYHFADATRILGLHKRQDLLETIYDSGLAEAQSATTETLAEMKTQLNAQVPRIRELRVKKAEEPLSFYDANAAGDTDIPDNVSVAATDVSTTGGTLFTRYTNRTGSVATDATRATSKKRWREERKRARGKKGSVYEEEYLINSVGRLIDRVNSIGDEVQRLTMALMRRGMRERARAVENAMTEVVHLCKTYAPEVFQQPAKEVPLPQTDRPLDGEGTQLDGIEQAQAPREAPLIKAFERMSFLSVE